MNNDPENEIPSVHLSNSTIGAGRDVNIGSTIIQQSSEKKLPQILTEYLPRRSEYSLFGRMEDLENVRKKLIEDSSLVLVNAIGGIGKTSLAEAYVEKFKSEYKHVAWIVADHNSSFLESFSEKVQLLKTLEISTEGQTSTDIGRSVLFEMKNVGDSPCLLVIDNAEDDLVKCRNLLPGSPNWHVLVTSRNKMECFEDYSLGSLSKEDAIDLFISLCPRIDDRKAVNSLLEPLEYHTLATEMLAKTANKQRLTLDQLQTAIPENLKSSVRLPHNDEEKIDRLFDYLTSIFSISKLDEDEIWILQQFCCLPSQEFSYEMLINVINSKGSSREEQFPGLLAELTEKGWLDFDEGEESYRLHRLLNQVVQKIRPVTLQTVSPLLVRVTAFLNLDRDKDNPIDFFQWVPFGRILTKRFIDETGESISELQNNLAMVLKDLGEYEEAKNLLQKALASDEKNFGEGHPSTARTTSNLAMVLKDLGEYEEAKTLLQKALASAEYNLGEGHPSTAIRYSNLAMVLKDLGEYEEAKTLLQKALASDEKNLGEGHPSTAIRYSNLAMVLKDLGEYEEAKTLLQKSLASDEKNFGESHPSTARTTSNLALVLKNLGEYEEAKTLLQKALASAEYNLGEGHPSTAIRYSNLALVLKDLGEYEEAKTLLQKALASDEENLGEGHPMTARTTSNLALVLQNLGDYEEAKTLFQKALDIFEAALPVGHPSIDIVKGNLESVVAALQSIGSK